MPTEHNSKKRFGRPPSGTDEQGNLEPVSKYPKLTVIMKPAMKARLDAITAIFNRPAWRIIDEALEQYMKTIPAEDRQVANSLARRRKEHLEPTLNASAPSPRTMAAKAGKF